jgi:hypothetical protein
VAQLGLESGIKEKWEMWVHFFGGVEIIGGKGIIGDGPYAMAMAFCILCTTPHNDSWLSFRLVYGAS